MKSGMCMQKLLHEIDGMQNFDYSIFCILIGIFLFYCPIELINGLGLDYFLVF